MLWIFLRTPQGTENARIIRICPLLGNEEMTNVHPITGLIAVRAPVPARCTASSPSMGRCASAILPRMLLRAGTGARTAKTLTHQVSYLLPNRYITNRRDCSKVSSCGSIVDMEVKAQRTWTYGDAESYSGAARGHLVAISGANESSELPQKLSGLFKFR